MFVYRAAELSDALFVARTKAAAFVRYRVKRSIAASILIAAMLPTQLMYACARIAAKEQWVTDRGACVVLAEPLPRTLAGRMSGVYAASFVVVLVFGAALLILPLLLGWFVLSLAVCALLAIWVALLVWGAVITSSGSRVARRELRDLKKEMPGGWVIQDLASDSTSFGSAFSLTTAAVEALLEGSVVYAAAADDALAKLYRRRMEPCGTSGRVFFAITKSSESVTSSARHVDAI